jgi:hypothetical protein
MLGITGSDMGVVRYEIHICYEIHDSQGTDMRFVHSVKSHGPLGNRIKLSNLIKITFGATHKKRKEMHVVFSLI